MTYSQLQDLRFHSYAHARMAQSSRLSKRYRIRRNLKKMVEGTITLYQLEALWPRMRQVTNKITNAA